MQESVHNIQQKFLRLSGKQIQAMKNLLFSIRPFYNFPALFLLRLTAGLAMLLFHGLPKLHKALEGNLQFADPLGLGSGATLYLVIFAEVICCCLLIVGLFTRLALLPLIIDMAVAFFIVHRGDEFAAKEPALLYFGMFVTLFLTGPGKFSLDRYF